MLSTSYTNAANRADSLTLIDTLRGPRLNAAPASDFKQSPIQPVIHSLDPPRPANTETFWLSHARTLKELDVSYDSHKRILWQFMNPQERACFTPELIGEISRTLDLVEETCRDATYDDSAISYLVLASRVPGVFNLGGHLPLFIRLIEGRNQTELRRYAHACVNEQYRWAINMHLPICTIAVVQGDALGGGFEAALSHDLIIAERSAKFGLPEVLFNLFPGMGAYTFLARKLGIARAEKMILSGKIYAAEELYEMGVVDRVVDDGTGVNAVDDLIKEQERSAHARQAVLKARQIVSPITRSEMMEVTDLWVDMAMSLAPRDLRRMRHLATAQDRRWAKTKSAV